GLGRPCLPCWLSGEREVECDAALNGLPRGGHAMRKEGGQLSSLACRPLVRRSLRLTAPPMPTPNALRLQSGTAPLRRDPRPVERLPRETFGRPCQPDITPPPHRTPAHAARTGPVTRERTWGS